MTQVQGPPPTINVVSCPLYIICMNKGRYYFQKIDTRGCAVLWIGNCKHKTQTRAILRWIINLPGSYMSLYEDFPNAGVLCLTVVVLCGLNRAQCFPSQISPVIVCGMHQSNRRSHGSIQQGEVQVPLMKELTFTPGPLHSSAYTLFIMLHKELPMKMLWLIY